MSQHKSKHTVVPYCVPKGITHLMIWVGSCLPKAREVTSVNHKKTPFTYQIETEKGCYVDYVKTLKEECKKMKEKGETCILVYSRSFINIMDVVNMNRIIDKIENCYLVKYEDFVDKIKDEDIKIENKSIQLRMYGGESRDYKCTTCTQKDFIDHINEIISNIMLKKTPEEQIYSNLLYKSCIGNLVDCMRMLLLAHPSKLKQCAIESQKSRRPPKQTLNIKDFSLLYHDFDMIQIDTTTKSEQDGVFSKTEPQLIFLKPQENSACSYLENGLILANSPKDRNLTIEEIWFSYMNAQKNVSIFDIIQAGTRTVMNCDGQWKEEGHRSWCIKPQSLEPIISTNKELHETSKGFPKINDNKILQDYKTNNKNQTNNKESATVFPKIGGKKELQYNNEKPTNNKNLPQPPEQIISKEKDTKITPVLPKIKIKNQIKSQIENKHTDARVKAWLKYKKLERIKEQKKTTKQLQIKYNNRNIIMHRNDKYELKYNNKVCEPKSNNKVSSSPS